MHLSSLEYKGQTRQVAAVGLLLMYYDNMLYNVVIELFPFPFSFLTVPISSVRQTK